MKKEKICGIYKIQNKTNGKIYIGQSVNIIKRFYMHRYNAFAAKKKDIYHLYLYEAIRKYGKDGFTYEIIEECKPEQLDKREQYWIKFYKSNEKDCGYNLSSGGNDRYTRELTSNSNITSRKNKVLEIKDLLRNSDISIQEIAKKYNMTTASITNINRGHSWHFEDEEYPIRDTRAKRPRPCPICGKEMSYQSKLCKKCDSERQHKVRGHFIDVETFAYDLDNYGITELAKKYEVTMRTICRWVKKYGLEFRGWNQKRRLKYEQV